ncbi:hypothetical protein GONAM_29_00300 [Gordonia namibiensis NBRC 108229]|uniref:DUF2834 domain-containing protein n=1 Tax=Gordonia namibiensis NBRC 108229 TaxID=1208314 RepID=K6WQ84_9ACTN|nr:MULTISPECIES: DUF2834 domain-containing protein [Gordonia]MDJ0028619.1 DUF2834 domain-containing protein [Gordonia alkanivorans]GAC01586.1 hypothetical protein GONAM_29_00300 [Gordonia namibiensis NBRC 108229]
MTYEGMNQKWRERSLFAVFVTALVTQNAIAIPYVARNGPESVKDFFVGDIMKTTPGRFAMVDLLFVVIAFHLWAFGEAKRLRIMPWWFASVVLTFGVGIATAIPFFFLARERAMRR